MRSRETKTFYALSFMLLYGGLLVMRRHDLIRFRNLLPIADILKIVKVISGNWLVIFRLWLDWGIARPLSLTTRDWWAILEIIKQEVAWWEGIIAIFILGPRICRCLLLKLWMRNWGRRRFEQLCLITDPVVVHVGIQGDAVGVDRVSNSSLPETALGNEVLLMQGASKFTNFTSIGYHSFN